MRRRLEPGLSDPSPATGAPPRLRRAFVATVFSLLVTLLMPAASFAAATTWQSRAIGIPAESLSRSVAFVDAQHAWVGTDHGGILVSSDGGSTWQTQTSGVTTTIYTIDFVSATTGWAATDGATVLRTTNGGGTWTASTVVGGNLRAVSALGAGDATHAWAYCDGNTYRTTDGGAGWQQVTSLLAMQVSDFAFVDAAHGWAVGNGGIKATTDGGDTWTLQAPASAAARIDMADSQHGMAVGSSSGASACLRTTDGGATWNPMSVGLGHPTAVAMGDADSAWITEWNWLDPYTSRVWATDDGGDTWVPQTEEAWSESTDMDVAGDTGMIVGRDLPLFSDHDGFSDLRPPLTTVSGDDYSNSDIPVTISASDADSGVLATFYQLDGLSWLPWLASSTLTLSAPSDHSNDGMHLVSAYSIDKYGNQEEPTTQAFTIDTQAPVVTLSGKPKYTLDYWNHVAATVSYTATDEPVGAVDAVEWMSPTSGWQPWPTDGLVFAAPSDHSNDGAHEFTVRVTDRAGNATVTSQHACYIDTRKPTVTAGSAAGVTSGGKAALKFKILDKKPCCGFGRVMVKVTTPGGALKKTLWPTKWFKVGVVQSVTFTCKLPRGAYRFHVYVLSDGAANRAARPATNTLTVR